MRKYKGLLAGLTVVLSCSVILSCIMLSGCEDKQNGSELDTSRTMKAGSVLQKNQPTPTDISYSLERYNLIRRTYWINGQKEKANTLPCEVEKPLGYVVLFSGNVPVATFAVDGKVSSLNSFLTPDSEHYEKNSGSSTVSNEWIPDVDGSYGENDNGIFFFTPDGNYFEWNQGYLYSDVPFDIKKPVLEIKNGGSKDE